MPAGSVYAAPVGTPLGSGDWKLIGHTTDGVTTIEPFTLDSDEAELRLDGVREWPRSVTLPSGGWKHSDLRTDEVAAISKRMAERWLDSQYSYSMPSRWLLGCPDPNINERSKPVGLTTSHKYTDNDGDTLTIDENTEDDLAIAWIDRLSNLDGGFNVTAKNSVPLALNVLGYDRPSIERNAAGATEYKGRFANYPIPGTQGERDQNVAVAIDYLRGADIFDQRTAANEAEAAAQAKRDAEYAKHRQISYDRAKQAYADAIRDQIASGIDAESAAKVQAALSAYETARRKLEGLPS